MSTPMPPKSTRRQVSFRLQAAAHTPDGMVLNWLDNHPVLDSKFAVKRLIRAVYGPAAHRAAGATAEQLREMSLTAIRELQFLIFQISQEFAPDAVVAFPTARANTGAAPELQVASSEAHAAASSESSPSTQPQTDELFGDYSAKGLNLF